jgi:RNA polymerase sigma-70 factor (ECF subfamily)
MNEETRNDTTQLSQRMSLALAAAPADRQQLDNLLELCRPLLTLIALQMLGSRTRQREGDSEIVQATLIEAHRDFAMFKGATLAEFLGWLKRLHRNNIQNTIRFHRAAKRDTRREVNLPKSTESDVSLSWYATAKTSSPDSQILRTETSVELAAAIAQLPNDQRIAITLRHIEGCSLEEICQAMEKSPASVAGLLRRGLAALQTRLGKEGSW